MHNKSISYNNLSSFPSQAYHILDPASSVTSCTDLITGAVFTYWSEMNTKTFNECDLKCVTKHEKNKINSLPAIVFQEKTNPVLLL